MTREEAIEVLKNRYYSGVTRSRPDDEWRLATDTALAALREKAERERGCEWCAVTCYVCVRGADGGCGHWDNCSRANVKDEDYPHDQDLYNPKPYCDRCGRKLKEDVHN